MIRNSRRMAAIAVGGALAATALSGCGAGFQPQTAKPSELTEGINLQVPQDTATSPKVQIRNLFILGPAGGKTLPAGSDVPVYAGLVNSTTTPDSLTSVASDTFAGGSQITGGAITLPPQQLVSLNSGTAPLVVLKGLTSPIGGGDDVKVTLTFGAGSVTALVPVIAQDDEYATYPAVPAPAPTPTAAAPTATATPAVGVTPAASKKAKKAATATPTP